MAEEADFIAALRAIAADPGARGLYDDAALLELPGATLVLTHDMMIEGVHWLPQQDPADVAWKLVAVNLSDLAAKGAEPLALLMGYTLGDAAWNARFVTGLGEAMTEFGVPLLGGDTVATRGPGDARAIGLTAIGRPVVAPPPSRCDAQPGERLFLTGPVGAALAGFEAFRAESADAALTAPYRRPCPLLREGRLLAPGVGAMMDVSDGLLLDARRMAEASGVTFAIDADAVPVVPALAGRRAEAMRWGDDYQLLFTFPPDEAPPVPAQEIGAVHPSGDDPLLLDGIPPDAALQLGYSHTQK